MSLRMRARTAAKWGVDRGMFTARRLARRGRPTLYVAPSPSSPLEASDWAALRRRRVFFGHQSVGENILKGVRELAVGAAEPPPRIVSLDDREVINVALGSQVDGAGFIAEAHIGRNGDPEAKMADFMTYLRGGVAARVDTALMKLCYVDFGRRTRPERIFARYRDMADDVARDFPDLMLVHATVPLTTGPSLANALRGEYNSLLRAHYSANRVLDIAALECPETSSTRRSSPRPFAALGRETLDPSLTTDGGHLNDVGSRRVAAGFVAALGSSATPERHA